MGIEIGVRLDSKAPLILLHPFRKRDRKNANFDRDHSRLYLQMSSGVAKSLADAIARAIEIAGLVGTDSPRQRQPNRPRDVSC